jgi:hypothetical protein
LAVLARLAANRVVRLPKQGSEPKNTLDITANQVLNKTKL